MLLVNRFVRHCFAFCEAERSNYLAGIGKLNVDWLTQKLAKMHESSSLVRNTTNKNWQSAVAAQSTRVGKGTPQDTSIERECGL